MRQCLRNVRGLTWTQDTVDAVPKLADNENHHLDFVAEAIGLLVAANAIEVAYKLIRMCKPEVRLRLLGKCSPHHAAQLKTSEAKGALEARNHTFSISAHDAWKRGDLPQFFKLLPFCSRETRASMSDKYGWLTEELVHGLDDDALIEAVRAELERIPARSTATHLLGLVPARLQSEVLRIAVDQAGKQKPSDIVTRLSELASLSNEIQPELATRILRELINLPEQWDHTAFGRYTEPLLIILQRLTGGLDKLPDVDGFAKLIRMLLSNVTLEQQSNILLSMVTLVAKLPSIEEAASHLQRLHLLLSLRIDPGLVRELQVRIKWALHELSVDGAEVQELMIEVLQTGRMAQEVQQALSDGDLEKAKGLVGSSRDIAFRDVATARLVEFGFESMEAKINARTKIDRTEEDAKSQALMVQVLERLGFGGDDFPSQLRAALPKLCAGANDFELDFILESDQGRRWVAQAMIDHLSMNSPSSAETVSLFTALAHRIDLRPAVSGSPRGTWALLEQQMASIELDQEKLTPQLHQSSPGWRTLLTMNLNQRFLLEDDLRRHRALMAVDAAAAAGTRPGEAAQETDVLGNPELDGWVQEALGAMLGVRVADQHLLSDDALRNVMRAVVSDKRLGQSTFDWIKERPEDQQLRLYTAIARELVSLLSDSLPPGHDEQRPANNAAAHAAYLLLSQPDVTELVLPIVGEKRTQLWALAAAKK